MFAYLKRFYTEAKKTLTAWIAMAISVISLIAARAEELLNQIPALKALLPAGPLITKFLTTWVIVPLGIFAAWARVRRILHPPKA